MDVGPIEPDLMIGEVAAGQLAQAFGTSAEFWLNLHSDWRTTRE